MEGALKIPEVDVWQVQWSEGTDVSSLWRHLSEDEMARAERFHFLKDRNLFIFGRATLKRILSYYCDGDIKLSYNRFGKPYIAGGNVHFNVSHSGDVLLYAISTQREVGVDIESIDREVDYLKLAERFFSGIEVQMLCQVSTDLVPRAFFNCWTRKEAYIKAHGSGLSLPLDSFSVSFLPGEPAEFLTPEQSGWSLYNLNAGPRYAAALVVGS